MSETTTTTQVQRHAFLWVDQERSGVWYVQCLCGERFRAALRCDLPDAQARFADHAKEA